MNRLKEQSRLTENEAERVELLKQKAKIISYLIAGSLAIVFCLVLIVWFASIIIKDNRTQNDQKSTHNVGSSEQSQENINLEQFIQDNIRVYSRITSKSPIIYALAKDIAAEKNTPEEKILATFLYVQENISKIKDDLPKPIFFFPEETLEEKKGNSSEIAILASAILYNMDIACELIEYEDRMGIRFKDIDTEVYATALNKYLPDKLSLSQEKTVMSQNYPIKIELPDKFAGLSLMINIGANNPIDVLLIDQNNTDSNKSNYYSGIKNGFFKIQYKIGSVLALSTKVPKRVELDIKIMIQRETILDFLPKAREKKRIDIYYDFASDPIASLTGKNPFAGKQIKIYPPSS